MGAGVQENDAMFGCGFESGEHAIEVEAFGGLGKIGVGSYREVYIGENLVVVGPGGVGKIYRGFPRVEF